MTFGPRSDRGERPAACARCTLPSPPGACRWCAHDPADPAAAADLAERRARLLALRADRDARRAWLAETGAAPLGSCPACGQWGRFGLCEHCGFDQTDEVAVAALGAHRAARLGARRDRQAQVLLGPKGGCDRCWLTTTGPVCAWCGHDNTDATARAELTERRWAVWDERRRGLRDRHARRARRQSHAGRPTFMACPNCSQRSAAGMCEWCDFDATDEVAVAARAAATAAAAEIRAARRAELRRRIAPPSRRQTTGPTAPAGAAAPSTDGRARRRFMTCPSCHSWSSAPVCDWCDFDATDTASVAYLAEEERFEHRRSQVRRRHAYTAVRNLIRFDIGEQASLIAHLMKWIVLGAAVGILAGGASAGFLVSLDWATNAREAHPWLLFLLPVAGFLVGLGYHYGGGKSAQGNNLIIDEIHEPRAWIPKRMAPLVYVGTILTHLFGGSAGREGTAIQMSGGLTDGFNRLTRLPPDDRRLLLIAAIAGGFGAVFGVPIAGCVFALEVQAVGRMRYDAIIPALTAPIVGDLVVHGLGVHHTPTPHFAAITLTAALLAKVAVAGLAFGLTSVLFSELTHGIKKASAVLVRWSPARPLIGGAIIIALTYAVGSRDYLGLSIPLITRSLAGGVGVIGFAFALKLLFTSVTLGSGFQGGEVTPLFVIGATLGATLGHLLGVPVPLMAALGFVAVFAGATNTPLACTIMGVELFGGAPMVLLAVACVVSYVFSSHRGIYGAQRIDTPKGSDQLDADDGRVLTLSVLARQRRLWLPARPGVAATTAPTDAPGHDDGDEEDAG